MVTDVNKITFKNIINESKKVKELPSDRWVTIEGKHILISNKGEIKAGLDKKYIGKKINNFVDDVKKDDKPKSNEKDTSDDNFSQSEKTWLQAIDIDKKYALKYYSDDGYKDINAQLRNGKISKFSEKIINTIDSLMENTKKDMVLKTNPKLYRGAEIPEITKALEAGKDITGFVFKENGYVSTSTDVKIAKDFVYSNKTAIFVINVPKGTEAIDMKKISRYKDENEILLGRGKKFKISKVEYSDKDKKHMPYIHVDIVPENIKENFYIENFSDYFLKNINYKTIKNIVNKGKI